VIAPTKKQKFGGAKLLVFDRIKLISTIAGMMKNCLRITHQGETIQLSWQHGQSTPRFANTVKFEHPFTQKVLEDLRWYLEDYLSFPYELKAEN
jgi:hypothetical protein